MQKIILLVTGISVFISCTKNSAHTSNQSQTSSTLTSITGDSADFSFVYEDGKVTDILARHDGGRPYPADSFYAPYAHLSYDSINYIKATSMEGEYRNYDYTEYYLNNENLPLHIIIHFYNNQAKDVVDFFYNPQTNLLDSVHDTNNGINYTSAIIQYDSQDITGVNMLRAFGSTIIETQNEYSYDKTQPNMFKTLDPLWYIYKTPFGTYNYGTSWVESNQRDIVKLFSQSTATQLHDAYSSYNSYWDTLHYTLNLSGKLETEWYSSNPDYILYYNYSN